MNQDVLLALHAQIAMWLPRCSWNNELKIWRPWCHSTEVPALSEAPACPRELARLLSALEAHPDIKIVLGGDTIVVGAYQALKVAGKVTDDMFLSGVDGDSGALQLVKQGGAYKLSIAFAWKLMGYGLGQFGADWIAGKQVPRVLVARGVKLDSAAAVTSFDAASADAASVFADRAAYEKYLPLYGNVSHATRSRYWSTAIDPPSGSA